MQNQVVHEGYPQAGVAAGVPVNIIGPTGVSGVSGKSDISNKNDVSSNFYTKYLSNEIETFSNFSGANSRVHNFDPSDDTGISVEARGHHRRSCSRRNMFGSIFLLATIGGCGMVVIMSGNTSSDSDSNGVKSGNDGATMHEASDPFYSAIANTELESAPLGPYEEPVFEIDTTLAVESNKSSAELAQELMKDDSAKEGIVTGVCTTIAADQITSESFGFNSQAECEEMSSVTSVGVSSSRQLRGLQTGTSTQTIVAVTGIKAPLEVSITEVPSLQDKLNAVASNPDLKDNIQTSIQPQSGGLKGNWQVKATMAETIDVDKIKTHNPQYTKLKEEKCANLSKDECKKLMGNKLKEKLDYEKQKRDEFKTWCAENKVECEKKKEYCRENPKKCDFKGMPKHGPKRHDPKHAGKHGGKHDHGHGKGASEGGRGTFDYDHEGKGKAEGKRAPLEKICDKQPEDKQVACAAFKTSFQRVHEICHSCKEKFQDGATKEDLTECSDNCKAAHKRVCGVEENKEFCTLMEKMKKERDAKKEAAKKAYFVKFCIHSGDGEGCKTFLAAMKSIRATCDPAQDAIKNSSVTEDTTAVTGFDAIVKTPKTREEAEEMKKCHAEEKKKVCDSNVGWCEKLSEFEKKYGKHDDGEHDTTHGHHHGKEHHIKHVQIPTTPEKGEKLKQFCVPMVDKESICDEVVKSIIAVHAKCESKIVEGAESDKKAYHECAKIEMKTICSNHEGWCPAIAKWQHPGDDQDKKEIMVRAPLTTEEKTAMEQFCVEKVDNLMESSSDEKPAECKKVIKDFQGIHGTCETELVEGSTDKKDYMTCVSEQEKIVCTAHKSWCAAIAKWQHRGGHQGKKDGKMHDGKKGGKHARESEKEIDCESEWSVKKIKCTAYKLAMEGFKRECPRPEPGVKPSADCIAKKEKICKEHPHFCQEHKERTKGMHNKKHGMHDKKGDMHDKKHGMHGKGGDHDKKGGRHDKKKHY